MSQLSCPGIKIPESFSVDLRRKLALLHEAPAGVAESTIALLGFGTRSALAASNPPVIKVSDDGLITITDEGRRIIEECAADVESQGEYGSESSSEDASLPWSSEHQARLDRALASLEDKPGPAPARSDRSLGAAHSR